MNKTVVAEYCRFSSHAQDEGFSIAAQQRAIANFAAANGYDIQYSYIDRAKTGTNANRPDFQRMMKDAKAGLMQLSFIKSTVSVEIVWTQLFIKMNFQNMESR